MTNAPLNWKADHIRFSIFSEQVVQEPIEHFYRLITGADPIEITQKPAAGESTATGDYEELKIEARRSFNRLDILLLPQTPSALEPSFIKDIESPIQLIKKLTLNHLKDRNDIIRIALAGNFYYEVDSPEQGYQKLAKMTRQNFNYEKHRDVIFQINFPTSSLAASGLAINRLMQWGVRFIKFNPPSDQPAQKTRYYCGCMTDFNTSAENKTPIDKKLFPLIFDELNSEMLKFITNGIKI